MRAESVSAAVSSTVRPIRRALSGALATGLRGTSSPKPGEGITFTLPAPGGITSTMPAPGAGSTRRPRPRRRSARTRAGNGNLLTVPEAATYFGVAQSTVFNLLNRGLPSIKTMGLGRRILRDKAEAWLIANGPERAKPRKK